MSGDSTDSAFRHLTQEAPRVWRRLALLSSDDTTDHQETLAVLAANAEEHGLTTLEAMVTAAGNDLTLLVRPGASGDQLHRARNLLAALCCTAVLLGDFRAHRLLAVMPRLGRRTMLARGRPLCDDERLLMRLIVTCRLQLGRSHHIAGAKYTLAEIGATPGEVTAIYIDDLDDPRHPTCVRAPGNRDREERTLHLDRWQSEVLGLIATTQAGHGDLDLPLAYHGDKKPGSSEANMACHRSLDILLNQAGLWQQEDVSASSITFSAADRIERQKGPEAAIRALGRTKAPEALREARAARDLRRLGPEPTPDQEPRVRSFLTEPFEPYDPLRT